MNVHILDFLPFALESIQLNARGWTKINTMNRHWWVPKDISQELLTHGTYPQPYKVGQSEGKPPAHLRITLNGKRYTIARYACQADRLRATKIVHDWLRLDPDAEDKIDSVSYFVDKYQLPVPSERVIQTVQTLHEELTDRYFYRAYIRLDGKMRVSKQVPTYDEAAALVPEVYNRVKEQCVQELIAFNAPKS